VKKEEEMPQGKVKWFDMKKGYGFILSDETKTDVFVHTKEVKKSGLETLEKGQRVEYETKVKNDEKQYAKNIKILTVEESGEPKSE
jgi:CspA family cold shock protein